MNIEKFIADRIAGADKTKKSISRPIVKIAIIGIILGVAVMLLTISIVTGFKKEITSKITGLTTDIVISNVNMNPSNEPQPIKISDDTLQLIKQIPQVLSIQKTAFKNGILKTSNENEGILVKGVDKEYDFTFLKKHLIEGTLPAFKDSSAGRDILISKALADKLGLKLNDRMHIYFISQYEIYDSIVNETYTKTEPVDRKFKICGIFKTDFADFDNNLSIVDLRQIISINRWKDQEQCASYEIKLRDFNQLDQTTEALRDLLGYNFSVNTVKESFSNIFIWLDKLDINGVIIITLMILVATINMITALLILILERTNMVGLLKSLGMTNINVRKIFFLVSFKLISRGLLFGNLIGLGICYLQYYFKIMKLDSSTYYVDFVAIDINWLNIILLNLGTFITCLLMLILPTLIITRLTPIKTLRFD